jgi:hypothetical protein
MEESRLSVTGSFTFSNFKEATMFNSQRSGLIPVFVMLAGVCGAAFLPLGSFVSADDYFVYSRFKPPEIPDGVVGVGGYVEDIGVPEIWGDEIQYVYFLSGTTGYKYRVWVTNHGGDDDPTPDHIDINQHPDHYDPAHVGPIEPRHFEFVSSANLEGYTSGSSGHTDEFQVDSTGIYLGASVFGIHKWDHDWTYVGQIAKPTPVRTESLAYDSGENTWYAGGRERTIYQLADTDGDGNFMDESWQAAFTYPSYAGSHHDGLDYAGGFLLISDMTSDVIGKWKYDVDTGRWNEYKKYLYSEPAYVEGMGFGPCNHFWIGGGPDFYELGGEINPSLVACAGEDVDSWPPDLALEFDASESYHEDPQRKIVLYEWDFEGDGVYDYNSIDPITEHIYPAVLIDPRDPGSIDWGATAACYFAKLRVTDDDPVTPRTAVDTRKVCITEPPWPPVADPGGPYNTKVNREIELDGSGSFHPAAMLFEPGDPWYDEIVLWEWDLNDDGVFETSGEIVRKSWPEEGFYSVSLRVTDGGGLNNEKRTTVFVGSIHDVAVDALVLSQSPNINVGEVISIDVTVSNKGDYTESFNLTLYCDNDVIDSVRLSNLVPHANKNLSFTWDTLGISTGSYMIKAFAGIVPGEFNVANNFLQTKVEVVDKCTLTISSSEGGSVTKPGEGTFSYNHNTTVEIKATAYQYYHFINWTGTAVNAGKVTDPSKADTTVLMDGDYNLKASFALEGWFASQ